ncbi:MAG: protein kinase, partial [Candidatus Eremiobacterota bacterium]
MWDPNSAENLDQLWKNALGYLVVELESDRGVILHDECWDGEYAVAAVRGVHPDEVWSGQALVLPLIRSVCKQRRPDQFTAPDGSHSAMCVPVRHGDNLLGLLYAHRLQGQAFEASHLEAATRFADQLGPVVARMAPPPAPPEVVEEPATDPEPGDLVAGRFALLKQVMVGRFSTLFDAEDRATGTPVRLRRVDPESATREARLQTLREGRLLSRLSHRNLPRVLEVVEDRTGIYLALEEFSGRTLDELVKEQGPLPPELLQRYLEQFLSVLAYLHGQEPPIIHRDLRPETVLVTPHGVLKLVEFGLARMRDSSGDTKGTVFRSQGSPHYAAPEQLLGEPSHPGNDLYSVGAILYFLATGNPPPRSVDRLFGAVEATRLESLGESLATLV